MGKFNQLRYDRHWRRIEDTSKMLLCLLLWRKPPPARARWRRHFLIPSIDLVIRLFKFAQAGPAEDVEELAWLGNFFLDLHRFDKHGEDNKERSSLPHC